MNGVKNRTKNWIWKACRIILRDELQSEAYALKYHCSGNKKECTSRLLYDLIFEFFGLRGRYLKISFSP